MTDPRQGRVAVLTIDDRAARGLRPDDNGAVLTRSLASIGLAVERRMIVSGAASPLRQLLGELGEAFELIIASGGVDRGALAPATLEALGALDVGATTRLEGLGGRATGFELRLGRALAVFLPASPPEMEAVLEEHLLPRLTPSRADAAFTVDHLLRISKVELPRIWSLIAELDAEEGVSLSVRPVGPELELSIRASSPSRREALGRVRRIGAELCTRLGHDVHGPLGQDLAGALVEALRGRGQRVATVEIGLGGALVDALGQAPGSEHCLTVGQVIGQVEPLGELLEIAQEARATDFLFSPEGALALARAARRRGRAELGLAAVLGRPFSSDPEAPFGLVHCAVTGREGEHQGWEDLRSLSRLEMRRWGAATALRLALDHCRVEKGG